MVEKEVLQKFFAKFFAKVFSRLEKFFCKSFFQIAKVFSRLQKFFCKFFFCNFFFAKGGCGCVFVFVLFVLCFSFVFRVTKAGRGPRRIIASHFHVYSHGSTTNTQPRMSLKTLRAFLELEDEFEASVDDSIVDPKANTVAILMSVNWTTLSKRGFTSSPDTEDRIQEQIIELYNENLQNELDDRPLYDHEGDWGRWIFRGVTRSEEHPGALVVTLYFPPVGGNFDADGGWDELYIDTAFEHFLAPHLKFIFSFRFGQSIRFPVLLKDNVAAIELRQDDQKLFTTTQA